MWDAWVGGPASEGGVREGDESKDETMGGGSRSCRAGRPTKEVTTASGRDIGTREPWAGESESAAVRSTIVDR